MRALDASVSSAPGVPRARRARRPAIARRPDAAARDGRAASPRRRARRYASAAPRPRWRRTRPPLGVGLDHDSSSSANAGLRVVPKPHAEEHQVASGRRRGAPPAPRRRRARRAPAAPRRRRIVAQHVRDVARGAEQRRHLAVGGDRMPPASRRAAAGDLGVERAPRRSNHSSRTSDPTACRCCSCATRMALAAPASRRANPPFATELRRSPAPAQLVAAITARHRNQPST